MKFDTVKPTYTRHKLGVHYCSSYDNAHSFSVFGKWWCTCDSGCWWQVLAHDLDHRLAIQCMGSEGQRRRDGVVQMQFLRQQQRAAGHPRLRAQYHGLGVCGTGEHGQRATCCSRSGFHTGATVLQDHICKLSMFTILMERCDLDSLGQKLGVGGAEGARRWISEHADFLKDYKLCVPSLLLLLLLLLLLPILLLLSLLLPSGAAVCLAGSGFFRAFFSFFGRLNRTTGAHKRGISVTRARVFTARTASTTAPLSRFSSGTYTSWIPSGRGET